jgi:hypothetical protein
MSESVKYSNTATVQLVPSAVTQLTSSQATQERSGRGVRVSLAEIQRLLGGSSLSMPLTDERKQHLEYLLDMGSRIKTRVTSGKATIAEMMRAAKEADGEEMFVKDFTNIIFVGHVRVRDVKRSCSYGHTYDGQITKQYCLGFAQVWDPMGKVDPVDFVEALSMEAEGHPRYIEAGEAMAQIFNGANNVRRTPTVEEDGYPSTSPSRWIVD